MEVNDDVRVWVKTSVLDVQVFGKAHTSTKRNSISQTVAGDADPHSVNWGWARARVLPPDGEASSSSSSSLSAQHAFAVASKPVADGEGGSDGTSTNDFKIQLYIEDEESEHNRTAIPDRCPPRTFGMAPWSWPTFIMGRAAMITAMHPRRVRIRTISSV